MSEVSAPASMASALPPSPSSSPRLPSPPPMAEDQTGPQSPMSLDQEHGKLGATDGEVSAARRIRPGTKSVDMNEGPPLMDLGDVSGFKSIQECFIANERPCAGQIESAFQLTEHLKALHHVYTHPDHLDAIVPIDRDTASLLSEPPDGIDRAPWLYELCRFLVQKVNIIVTALFTDEPPCSAQTCPEMRASEWQYLCAVHDPPKSCCAIDYCCHTLDWAANTLTSSKHFPSRLTLGTSSTASVQQQNQIRQLTNIFRRVYRIFAHAWFQHREIFWSVESKTGMYILFKTVCDMYNLIPEDNYTIPPEAEGLEAAVHSSADNEGRVHGLHDASIDTQAEEERQFTSGSTDSQTEAVNGMGATTKRYRHTHSKSASIVPTVPEEEAEEDDVVSETSEETSVLFDSSAQHPAFAFGLPIRDISDTNDNEGARPHILGLTAADSIPTPDLSASHDFHQNIPLAESDVETVADDDVDDSQPIIPFDTAEVNSA